VGKKQIFLIALLLGTCLLETCLVTRGCLVVAAGGGAGTAADETKSMLIYQKI
jgi:hypothetical protein